MLFMILAAAVFVVPEAEIFACTPVQVWDADGPIWCAEGPRIRLHGIAAREMDGTCRHGHPCPDMPPIAARDVLIKLLQPAPRRPAISALWRPAPSPAAPTAARAATAPPPGAAFPTRAISAAV